MAKVHPEPEDSPALIPPPRLPPTAVGLATLPPPLPPGRKAMTRTTYYRGALLVSLVLLAVLLIPSIGRFASNWDSLGVVVDATPIAGAPFLIFALALGVWVGRERNDGLRRAVWIAPFWWGLFFFAWCTVRTFIINGGVERGFLPAVVASTLSFLVVGYVYVGLVELLRSLAEGRGWVQSTVVAA